MALFGRKKSTIGLDIGSGLVKVAVVEHGKEPRLVRVAIEPLPPDSIVEGEVMDPGLVAETIRTTLDKADAGKGAVITAVGGRDVIIKKIQMQRAKEKEAREVMQYEAEQHVPFDMASVEMDFQILDPDDRGDEMSVLLVAAKRDLVEAKLRLLGDAGVTPAVVDVDAFALHNAFELNYPDAMQGVAVLINIGHETTNINILDDGVPILTRDIPVGTGRVREDLQRERGLGVDEATSLIQGYDRSPHLDAVIANRAEEIATGIERATAFLASTSRSMGKISGFYTCGGGSRIPGLADVLGDRLRMRVTQANPLASLHVSDTALDSYVTDEVAPLLMLSVGLALRQPA